MLIALDMRPNLAAKMKLQFDMQETLAEFRRAVLDETAPVSVHPTADWEPNDMAISGEYQKDELELGGGYELGEYEQTGFVGGESANGGLW